MVQRGQLSWQQTTRALFFIVLNSLVLGGLIGAVALGATYILEPTLRLYLGIPIVFAVIFVYGKLVWTPLWKLGVSRRWT